jgi:hypothetical protein
MGPFPKCTPPPSYYDSFPHHDLKQTNNLSTSAPSIELDALPRQEPLSADRNKVHRMLQVSLLSSLQFSSSAHCFWQETSRCRLPLQVR